MVGLAVPNGWPEWAGVIGCGIAVFAVVLQFLDHRWAKRSFRLQHEPRVTVRAIYNPPVNGPWVLQVYVVNVGIPSVHIRSVVLSLTSVGRWKGVSIPQCLPGGNPVDPGEERYYALQDGQYKDLPDISTLPRGAVSIEVATAEKTIYTLPGDKIAWIGMFDEPAAPSGVEP